MGNLHQLLRQRLFLLLAAACPATRIVRLDTWWMSPRGTIRPDLAVYRSQDVPEDREGAFRVPPLAIVEILSDDAHDDLVRKDVIHAEAGARRAYLDARKRFGWWLRLDGTDHDGPTAEWQLEAWPPLRFVGDELLTV